jgi:hypothetical protein
MASNDQRDTDIDQATVDAILAETDFPATRDDLVTAAEDADVDEAIISMFQDLPDDEYLAGSEVKKALGERSGSRS